MGSFTAQHPFQKRFAAGIASLCTNLSRLILPSEPGRAEVDGIHLLSTALILPVLFGCLAMTLSGCGGAFLNRADGTALQASTSKGQLGTASVGDTADINASILNQGSAQLEPSPLAVAEWSSSINAPDNPSDPAPSDSGAARLGPQSGRIPVGSTTGSLTTTNKTSSTLGYSSIGWGRIGADLRVRPSAHLAVVANP